MSDYDQLIRKLQKEFVTFNILPNNEYDKSNIKNIYSYKMGELTQNSILYVLLQALLSYRNMLKQELWDKCVKLDDDGKYNVISSFAPGVETFENPVYLGYSFDYTDNINETTKYVYIKTKYRYVTNMVRACEFRNKDDFIRKYSSMLGDDINQTFEFLVLDYYYFLSFIAISNFFSLLNDENKNKLMRNRPYMSDDFDILLNIIKYKDMKELIDNILETRTNNEIDDFVVYEQFNQFTSTIINNILNMLQEDQLDPNEVVLFQYN